MKTLSPNPARPAWMSFAALLCLVLGAGCASHKPIPSPQSGVLGRSCEEPEELLDVLARFSTAVQSSKYHIAIAMLVPEDQERMLTPTGEVPQEIRVKLEALDFQSLVKDRRIDLVRGRLKGIFDCLPCLDQGPSAADTPDGTPEPSKTPTGPLAEDSAAEWKAITGDFFRKIQTGRWDAAAELLVPGEWDMFLDANGNLSELNERRLQAIEECDLDALAVVDGKLTGVMLLLEPPASELYLKSAAFFDLVEADKLEAALAMLPEIERALFLDAQGNRRPEAVEKLQDFDRNDWNRLFLYKDTLFGVAEAALGTPVP